MVKGHVTWEATMKKIIDGKRYDTETADLIASAESRHNRGDFKWGHETLYRTVEDQYFIAGEGHAMSRWAQALDGNSRGADSGLELLTDIEALEWCERNDIDADVIAEHFAIEDA
jgi:hypothetical protein